MNKKYNFKKENKNKHSWNTSLSYQLTHWDINYNAIYNLEMNKLNFKQFRYLMGFRLGLNKLNAHNKYETNKYCFNCDKIETLIHYLFDCNKYNLIRERFMDSVDQILIKNNMKSLKSYDVYDRLYSLLYPFQNKIQDKDIFRNQQLLDYFIIQRMDVLNCLLDYVIDTERFANDYKYNVYFTF